MSADAPASAGRNLVGFLGVVLGAVVLYFALRSGAVWPWFVGHPGTLSVGVLALAATLLAGMFSQRVLVAVLVGVAVAVAASTVPGVQAQLAAAEKPILAGVSR